MNVLFSSDDNYAPLLGVSIFSLLKNNYNDFNEINIIILDGGISKENQEKIKSICERFPNEITLQFIKYKNLEEIMGMELKATRALSTYARLFTTSFLDNNIDKILYLDCDALIVDSLKELWDLNIDDYYCAAVLDATPNYTNIFLQLPQDLEHFNAGLLLINLKKWRDDNLEEKFYRFILDNNGHVFHNDQGVINVVCQGKILKIHPKYNILSPFFEVGYDKVLQWYNMKEYYSKSTVKEALNSPVFIHLTTFVNGRPWFNQATNHPLRKLFNSYVQETPFKDVVYVDDTRGWKGRFFSLTYKYLSYSVICSMFRVYEYLIIKRGYGSI